MTTSNTVEGSSQPSVSLLPSVVRTVVPLVAGVLITLLLKVGIHIDTALATQWTTVGVTAAYYLLVRFLETHGSAHFGWLLGLAKAPAYSRLHAPSPDSGQTLVGDVEATGDGRSSAL